VAGETGAQRRQPLGAFIRSQRRLAALSLRQLAGMTSVSNAYLSQIERGVHQPSLRVLRSLAQALDVPTTVLLEHAGMGELDDAGETGYSTYSTAAAIQVDPDLSEPDRELLLGLYERLRKSR
jgi:transcriptional regulator with XRE-family HTH domain